VLAAWGQGKNSGVWLYQRGKKVGELELPQGTGEEISKLIVLGSWIVGCGRNRIEVWKSSNLEHYTTIYSRSIGQGGSFTGSVCTMPTYLNKIFAGKCDGSVEIWNISTGKLVYTMLPAAADYGAVTALESAPALSMLAIAYEYGSIVIRNVKTDEDLISLDSGRDSGSAVTTISFRTDGLGAEDDGRKAGVMATASKSNGDVTFWDLNRGGRRTGVLRGAHSPPSSNGTVAGGITRVEFLAGQAVLLTSGMDNALKTWIFDDVPFSAIPRILHSRGGHSASVSTLQFLPSDADGAEAGGKWLLSTSKDRSFWGWSLRRDGQSTELSQGNIRKKAKKVGILNSALDPSGKGTTLGELKAPRITCMACSLNRDGGMGAMPGTNTIWTNDTKTKTGGNTSSSSTTGWESVVTGHEGDKFARTWFWGRKRAGRWKFQTGDGADVKVQLSFFIGWSEANWSSRASEYLLVALSP
jgi:U3 small nucleolar RNA-associated protein 21